MTATATRTAATYDDNGTLLSPAHVLRHCPERYNGTRHTGWAAHIAAEAVEYHFNGDDEDAACCSPENPCDLAAYHMLALGRHGNLAPHVPTEEEMAIHRPSPGTGTGQTPTNLATDKQVELLNTLCGELTNTTATDSEAYLLGELGFDYLDDAFPGLPLTKKVASKLITKMLPLVRARSASQRREQRKEETAHLEAGALYRYEGRVYRVHRSRQTDRLYAVELTLPEDGGKKLATEFAPGIIRKLTTEMKMDVGDVEEYGREVGFCGVCSRVLTRQESIDRGIGPVCAEKY